MTARTSTDRAASGRDVTISKPEKQLWPDLAFTKQEYADYLADRRSVPRT
jgi:DNA primase